MVTLSLGTSKVAFGKPSFTYTKTFARLPLSATTVSVVLSPPAFLQAGSWLMSILVGLGAVPSSFTLPLTLAAWLLSTAPEAGACEVLWSVVSSFLPQPMRAISNNRERSALSAIHFRFIVILNPFLLF